MSASSVIGDVTQTLNDLLVSSQQPTGMFDVSLSSPADEVVAANLPRVNLFLFRVTENAHLKNREWLPINSDAQQYPPLALTLFYVLTPFAVNKVDEHRVLGEAMRIFHDNSILGEAVLRGSLATSNDDLKLSLCQLSIEDLTRIWNALSRPYRLSVAYEVRVVLVDSAQQQRVTRVTEKIDTFYDLTRGRP